LLGGYKEDANPQGQALDNIYAFQYWQLIDIFIYFSHSVASPPPPCWINAAHKHDVCILGTVITEWEAGEKENLELIRYVQLFAIYSRLYICYYGKLQLKL